MLIGGSICLELFSDWIVRSLRHFELIFQDSDLGELFKARSRFEGSRPLVAVRLRWRHASSAKDLDSKKESDIPRSSELNRSNRGETLHRCIQVLLAVFEENVASRPCKLVEANSTISSWLVISTE